MSSKRGYPIMLLFLSSNPKGRKKSVREEKERITILGGGRQKKKRYWKAYLESIGKY